MANKDLFRTIAGGLLKKADAVNEAGGRAYQMDARHALAQYAATGCLNATYYASAEAQLEQVLALVDRVSAEFIARTAVYARERGFMKDLPALLVAYLTVRNGEVADRVFDRVIDDGKMLRNFVQILRSGVVGRKSLGSMPKRLVRRWFAKRSGADLFHASVGASPSLADVIKMAHPRPADASASAIYAYLLGREHDATALPEVVRRFEAYKAGRDVEVPSVPFQMLTALDLNTKAWAAIARNATWQQTRMNLNTFARHGVFGVKGMTAAIAAKLRDPAQVKRAKVLPYQIMTAYLAGDAGLPREVIAALEDAMEAAIESVPEVEGRVVVCPDVSGSMLSPVTGHRKGATTRARCIDVAALVAAAMMRKNAGAEVLPFSTHVVPVRLSGRNSVMTNAQALASLGGGGTSCSAPLAELNKRRAKADLVVFVSDNESWVDRGVRGTAMMEEWNGFAARNPGAKLVSIDIQPNRTVQAHDRDDVLNVGGFSDAVFEAVAAFASSRTGAEHWVKTIERTAI